MTVLIPRLKAGLAKQVAKYLKDSCTIIQRQPGIGPRGEQGVSAPVVIASNVPCRVVSTGGRFRSAADKVGDQLSIRDSYRLIVPAGTPIGDNLRVIINGLTYDIDSIQDAQTDALFYECFITRQGGQ